MNINKAVVESVQKDLTSLTKLFYKEAQKRAEEAAAWATRKRKRDEEKQREKEDKKKKEDERRNKKEEKKRNAVLSLSKNISFSCINYLCICKKKNSNE